jgi:hypothetical protein
MAEISPTAANILSSLGIKGATLQGGTASKNGFVPTLNAQGKLDSSVIDVSGIVPEIVDTPLTKVCFVDSGFAGATNQNGSIKSPFESIAAAAAAGYANIVVAGGSYADELITFSGLPANSKVTIIGLGKPVLSGRTVVNGLGGAPLISLVDLKVQGEMVFGCNASAECLGSTEVAVLNAGNGFEMAQLRLEASARVASTNAGGVVYIDETSRIANNSEVEGATAKDALNRLKGRRIKVTDATVGSNGLEYGSDRFIEAAPSGSSNSFDDFDLTEHDKSLIDAANEAFLHRGEDIDFDHITARTVEADSVVARSLDTDVLTIDGCRIRVDDYNYLVVDDSSSSSSYDDPPLLVSDTVTGVVYMLGVRDGRAFVRNAEISPDPSIPTEIRMRDEVAGTIFAIVVRDGVMDVIPVDE